MFPTASLFYDASQYRQPLSPPRAKAVSVSWRTMDDGGQSKREQLCMGGKTTTTKQLLVTKTNSKYGHSYEASGRKAPIVPGPLSRQAERKVGGTMLVFCTNGETNQVPSPWRRDEEESGHLHFLSLMHKIRMQQSREALLSPPTNLVLSAAGHFIRIKYQFGIQG